jgi:UDP-2,3-diacylglucosamine pyrophosphatase LpxH
VHLAAQPVGVIADSHLGGPGGDVEPLLAQLESAVAGGTRDLVLLGDVFQAWVGLPRFETPPIRRLVEALAALRRRGVWIAYVEGNRDFYLTRERYSEAFDVVATEVALRVGERRLLFVHGDGLNDRDWQYRFWRRLSKSAPVKVALGVLPRKLAMAFVERTDRRLASTNFKHKRRIPEEAILDYGARRLGEGFDLLVLGHFHEPRAWPCAGGEVRVLDAWFHSRTLETLA